MAQGFFELTTPRDLLEKLKREYERLRQSPLDQDVAFNLFSTAEHISDWLYPGYKNRIKRKNLRASNVLLQICSHIASGLKHFQVEDKHHKSVSGMSVAEGPFDSNIFQNDAFDVGHLAIDLNEDAAKQLGPSINALELAGKVLEFWIKHIEGKTSNTAFNPDAE